MVKFNVFLAVRTEYLLIIRDSFSFKELTERILGLEEF
jgi:hypothetical protein